MSDEKTAPAFLLKLDNARLAPEKEAQIKAITVISKINDPSKFMIDISDPDGEWIDSDDVKIGVKVNISLGYKDDVSEIIQGQITGMTASFSRIFGRTLTVTGYDNLHKLSKVKKTRSFLEKSHSDAIKEIIQEASLQCEVSDLGAQRTFIFQKDQTDIAFIRELADKYDLTMRVEGEKIIIEEFSATRNEDVVLEWNKSLIKFSPESNCMNVFTDIDLYSWNGRRMESAMSSKTNSESESDDLKLVAEKFGEKKQYVISRDVLDMEQADKIALKMLKRNSRGFIHASGLACGDANIKGGTVIKVKGISTRWDRLFHVIYARHTLVPGHGYTVEFETELYTGRQSNFGGTAATAGSSESKEETSASATNQQKKEETKGPQLKNLKWKDKDNKEITKAHVGDKVKITADVTDIDDGVTVNIKIFEKDDDNNDDYVIAFGSRIKNGKVEAEWDVTYTEDNDDTNSAQEKEEKGYTLPEYVFKMDCPKHSIEDVESTILEIIDWLEVTLFDLEGKPLANENVKLILENGSERSCTTDSEGKLMENNLISRTIEIISENYSFFLI